jgi:outer membrane protein OmpA-like peptidoglycan-associated protein
VLRAQGKSRLLPRTLAIASDGLFASGSSTLSAAGKRFAARTATQLKGAVRITCTGYTDNTGAASFNKALGLARAKAVCAALRKAGLGKKVQLVTRSGGPSHPRAKNDTAAGRAKNRRVELAVRYGR